MGCGYFGNNWAFAKFGVYSGHNTNFWNLYGNYPANIHSSYSLNSNCGSRCGCNSNYCGRCSCNSNCCSRNPWNNSWRYGQNIYAR